VGAVSHTVWLCARGGTTSGVAVVHCYVLLMGVVRAWMLPILRVLRHGRSVLKWLIWLGVHKTIRIHWRGLLDFVGAVVEDLVVPWRVVLLVRLGGESVFIYCGRGSYWSRLLDFSSRCFFVIRSFGDGLFFDNAIDSQLVFLLFIHSSCIVGIYTGGDLSNKGRTTTTETTRE
jgi:hypothetical protein